MNRIAFARALTASLCLASGVNAQDVQPSVNPANVMDSVDRALTVPPSARPKHELETADEATVPADSPNANAEILLKEVTLIGATHAVPASVTAIYQQLIGQTVTFGAVQKMVADMQAAYRDAGQFLVRVVLPPQEIDRASAAVQVRIVEGQIEKVVFPEEKPRAIRAQMQRYARTVEENDPVTYASVDRFLLLANDLPGMQVSATLMPNAEVTGGADLLMTAKHTRGSGFTNLNNHGSKYIGPSQMSLGGTLYGIMGADSLSVAVATMPNDASELAYGNVNYGIVLGARATRVNASATATHTEPGDSLSAFDMSGESEEYRLSVEQPLIVSTPHRLTLLASLSHLDSHNDVFDDQQLYQDTVTPFAIGMVYQGAVGRAYNDVRFTATQGLSLLGASQRPANPSVAGAKGEFLRFNFESTTVRYVSNKASVVLGTQFQLSRDRLISSERLSYGGARFGQAYHYNVISGDSGALGSLALRYDVPTHGWLNQLQPEVFYDAGAVRFNDTPAGESDSATATSAGVGLNLLLLERFKARVILAKPLSIDDAPDLDRGWQSFFNITGVF